MDLPWYKNIKPLLKLDGIYSLDHVTAHRMMRKTTQNITTQLHPPSTTQYRQPHPKICQNACPIKPL